MIIANFFSFFSHSYILMEKRICEIFAVYECVREMVFKRKYDGLLFEFFFYETRETNMNFHSIPNSLSLII